MKKQNHAVLYIDDEVENLINFKHQFGEYYKIYTAASAAEGYNFIKKYNIKIIIADQRMPVKTGAEFFEDIAPEFPDTVRVILTGYSDIDALVDSINKGKIFYYLQKPWKEKEILTTIDNAIETIVLAKENRKLVNKLKTTNDKLERQYIETKGLLEKVAKSEKSIRESEERLRAIVKAQPDLIFLVNEKGKFIEILTSARDLLYKEESRLKGKIIPKIFPDKYAELFMQTIRDTIKSGKTQIIEYNMKVPAGKRWFEGRTASVNLNFDGIKTIVFIARDITKRKEAEIELKKHREHLEELVKERTIEMEKSNTELKKRTEELENFNKVMVDRELRMIDLKKEINILLGELNREERYPDILKLDTKME